MSPGVKKALFFIGAVVIIRCWGLHKFNEAGVLDSDVKEATESPLTTKDVLKAISEIEYKSVATNAIAERKRRAAKALRQAAGKSREIRPFTRATVSDTLREWRIKGGREAMKREYNSRKRPILTLEEYLEASNIQRAEILEAQAALFDSKINLVQSFQMPAPCPPPEKHAQFNEILKESLFGRDEYPACDMMKVGPLEFGPTLDEIRHRVGNSKAPLMGKLDGNNVILYQGRKPRFIFSIDGIEPPIFHVPNTAESCWGFKYFGVDQLFCAHGELVRDSWIDAVTEAWFCRHEGLRGTMPSLKAAMNDVSKRNTNDELAHQAQSRQNQGAASKEVKLKEKQPNTPSSEVKINIELDSKKPYFGECTGSCQRQSPYVHQLSANTGPRVDVPSIYLAANPVITIDGKPIT